MSRLITDLIGAHRNKRIVVMGGGLSLPESVQNLQADIWISANQHGAKLLQDTGRRADYIYAADVYHQVMMIQGRKMHMRDVLRPFGVPVITKRWWGDYRIPTAMFPITGNSGLQAIGAAMLLGGNPIIVAGIEMYRGGGTYFHDQGAHSSGLKRDMEDVEAVIAELAAAVKGQNVRRIGCPLLPFPEYDPAEVFADQPPMPLWAQEIAQATQHEYRVRWSFMQHGEQFKGRETIMLTHQEASQARMSPRLAPVNPADAVRGDSIPARVLRFQRKAQSVRR